MVNRFAQTITVVLFASLAHLGSAFASEPQQFGHITVSLVSELSAAAPGSPFLIGLHLQPEKGWGTYWRNPGQAGLATRVRWQLPDGWHVGHLRWPYPERITVQGVTSYGYHHDVLLLARVTPPETTAPKDRLRINADASWLACKRICVPGDGHFSLTLPIGRKPVKDDSSSDLFQAARRQLPRDAGSWKSRLERHGNELSVHISAPRPLFTGDARISFFPIESGVVSAEKPPLVKRLDAKTLTIRLAPEKHEPAAIKQLPGVLVVHDSSGSAQAYRISATDGTAPARAGPAGGVAGGLVLALLGGILLNLMPCVFPVLSCKAVMLMESTAISRRAHQFHGLAYTGGVVAFFAVLGSVLFVFKAEGAAVGWGFQLQTPWFVGALAYLLTLMGLSFSGLVTIGGSIMGLGNRFAGRGGYAGSFATGALAAVVASPCTAPFMGTAVAYALTRPAYESLLLFGTLGLGMSLPFLLVAFMPPLGRLLPRPGRWMNVFKELMAFPLYLTAIWLLWVVGRQTGATGMAVVATGMLMLIFASWVYGVRPSKAGPLRLVAAGSAVASVGVALALLSAPMLSTRPEGSPIQTDQASATGSQDRWIPYDEARLRKLDEEGHPVFVNMTADWCISCIANEQVALSAPSVRRAFNEHDVVLMKGDWTRRDAEITRVLERFGRSGVPLYLLYPGNGRPPDILPQWLTPGIVRNAVLRATAEKGRPTDRPTFGASDTSGGVSANNDQ